MTEILHAYLPAWSIAQIDTIVLVIVACVAGFAVHYVAAGLLTRLVKRSTIRADDILLKRLIRPTRWGAVSPMATCLQSAQVGQERLGLRP